MHTLNLFDWLPYWVTQWQQIAQLHPAWANVYLLASCSLLSLLLFLSGTVLGVCGQSLWAIFISHRAGRQEESLH